MAAQKSKASRQKNRLERPDPTGSRAAKSSRRPAEASSGKSRSASGTAQSAPGTGLVPARPPRPRNSTQVAPSESKRPDASRVVLSTLMMPEHANHFGNVHGGIIMKLADEAAAIASMRHAQRPSVTVAIDSMTFKEPINVGDLVTCSAHVTYVHRSSMEVAVVVHAENLVTGQVTHTNSAYLVFVALSDDGRPAPVPALAIETPTERSEYEKAEERQRHRLAQRRQG